VNKLAALLLTKISRHKVTVMVHKGQIGGIYSLDFARLSGGQACPFLGTLTLAKPLLGLARSKA
jgi:hypothetical protein